MTTIAHIVLYYPQGDDATVYEVTEYTYRYLKAQGVRVPQSVTRPSWMSVGLLVRHMAHTTCTRTDLLGDTLVHLLHPEALGCDGDCWYLLTQKEYEGFYKRAEYHCSILPEVF